VIRLGTLDRTILRAAAWRWLIVLALGCALILAVDFVARSGIYVQALARAPGALFLFQLVRLPDLIQTFLPISALAAGMLTAAPLMRDGTLVALCAAGLTPARVLRATLLVAIASGVLGIVIADQVAPRVLPTVSRLEAAMEDRKKAGYF
jgi:lipopolysaccharide export LptBFGC system permease protein LptF